MGFVVAVPARSVALARVLVAVLALVLVPITAQAQRPTKRQAERAQKLVRIGLEAYAAKKFAEAAKAFQAAHAISPDEQTLFAWAQAERFAGDCRRALELFQRLLEEGLSDRNRSAVRASMTECTRIVTAEPGEVGAPGDGEPTDGGGADDGGAAGDDGSAAITAGPTDGGATELAGAGDSGEAGEAGEAGATSDAGVGAGEAVALDPGGPALDPGGRDDTGGGSWYTDPVGGALCGLGVVGLGAGVGLLVSASSADGKADSATSYGEYAEHKDRARSRGRLAVISASVGAVLLGTGVAWYWWQAGRAESGPTVSLWREGGGTGLAVAGRF